MFWPFEPLIMNSEGQGGAHYCSVVGAFVTVGLVYEDFFSTVPDAIGKL